MPDYSIGRYLVYTRDIHRSGELVSGELPMAIDTDSLQTALATASQVLGVASWVRVYDTHLGIEVDQGEPDDVSSYFASSYFATPYFGGLGG